MTVDLQLLERARSTDADLRQRAAVQVVATSAPGRLPLMFEMLGDRDWRVRKTIVDGFLRSPDDEIIRGLLHALRDPENAGRRNSATEALVRIGDPAIPHIIRGLAMESDVDVRLSLVNLLGDLRTDDGYEELTSILDTEQDINVISSIVTSIGKYRRASGIPPLLKALQREDLWLKFHVVEALGEIGDRTALPAILPLYAEKSLRKPVLEAVGKIGDVGTVGFLMRIIADEDKLNLPALRALMQIAEVEKPRVIEASERQMIVRKFRESFPRHKIAALVDHLRSTPKREVKNFILKFLGWSGVPDALGELLGSLQDPESAEVAAQSLIDFGTDAIPAILETLRTSEEDDVTSLLLRVLNVIGRSESVPSIVPFLDHENPMIRRLAIETIGQIAEPMTVDYLLAKLDDADVACQQAAVNAITRLVELHPNVKGDTLTKIRRLLTSKSIPAKLNSLSVFVNIQGEGYSEELLLASKDGDPVIRQKAVSLMGRFSHELFADQLVLSLADESTAVRIAAINAIVKIRPESGLEPLISSLEDQDIWIRTAAAQALGEYRHPAAIDPLIRHLRADPTPVKIAIIEALGKSEREDVRAILFEALHQSDPEIRRAAILALSRIPGETVFERLIVALSDADWRIRAAAATALGLRGDVRSLSPLHEALVRDSDAYVQQSAVVALDRFGDRSSFNYLLASLENKAILDDVAELLVRHRETYRDLLESAWRTADSRQEAIIAAILQAMKGNS